MHITTRAVQSSYDITPCRELFGSYHNAICTVSIDWTINSMISLPDFYQFHAVIINFNDLSFVSLSVVAS